MIKNLKWKAVLIAAIVAGSIWMMYPPSEKVKLGLDLQGGMHLVLRVDTTKLSDAEKRDAAERVIEVIRNRIDQFGVTEPLVQRQGRDRIVIQLPGITDRERALQIVRQTAHLEFRLVSRDPQKLSRALEGDIPAGYELKYLDDRTLLLEKEAVMTGEAIVDARMEFSANQIYPYVGFSLKSKGARKFARLTRENVGRQLAIVLDGKVKSAPVIREEISGGRGQITGRFNQDEVADLALVLRTGALPAPVEILEERTVGPTLGKDSIAQGINSIILGATLVVGFMCIYYLLAGLIANFALFLNIVIILAVLSYPRLGASLTLPGIAGIVLTIGMAVDANVLIFERIREELNLGKSLRLSISTGYQKAFFTILDANVTTLIAAFILFQFGTGPVKGFATTLTIGICASMFTAIFVTRTIFDYFTLNKKFHRLPMLQFFKRPKLNFINIRKPMYVFSALVITLGLLSFVSRGEKNLGVDFSGGTLQQFRFQEDISSVTLRNMLKEIELADSLIQRFGNEKEVIIRTYGETTDRIMEKFARELGANNFEVLRIEKVGPAVGKDLAQKGIKALLFALLGICAYISLRFEFKFAIAAIIALFHDVLICLGALSITGRELSLPVIAALLAVIGYSINDTIVVFDRVREDTRLMQRATFPEVVNTSINQTLNRTLLTSTTTLLVVLSLFFLGGEVINSFAFVLLVGVIVGTYSSIFIASPLVVDWKHR